MLAEEAERQQIHVVLGPTINLHRSPLGGRLFEQYSEDPLLTGRLAAAYVKGLQDKGIGACLKHLVANESETVRNYMDSVVSEAALREVYLLPFEIAVEESDPWSIMAAYNDVNGVAATEQDHVNNEVRQGRVGLGRPAHERLVRHQDLRARRPRRPRPGHARPGGAVGRGAGRRRRVRRGARVGHRRARVPAAAARGAGRAPSASTATWPADRPRRTPHAPRAAAPAGHRRMVVLATGRRPAAGRAAARWPSSAATPSRPSCMGGGSAQVNPPYQVSVAEGLRRGDRRAADRRGRRRGARAARRRRPGGRRRPRDRRGGRPGPVPRRDGVVMGQEHPASPA